jgi:triacylglycerol esterase/lipase EstA (alpha/beta hydrolase family)
MKTLLLLLLISCNCYSQKLPIVFVHGFLASGDTWSTQINRFLQNGYTKNELQVFDWNTINGKNQDSLLGLFIDSVMLLNKTEKINLIGHSAGGSLSYKLTKSPNYSSKIAAYIHIGSSPIKNAAGNNNQIPTYIIYSSTDYVAKKINLTDSLKGWDMKTKDHYEVATSEETFKEIFLFLNKYKPTQLLKSNATSTCYIRILYFGTNEILANSIAQVQQYNSSTGNFLPNTTSYTSNHIGWWTMQVNNKEKNNYALSIQPNEKARRVTYFFEKINKNKIISLRAFNNNNMIGMLLSQLPNDSLQPALCIFTSNQSIVSGRDTLTVNGLPISGATLTPANKTIIASFIYDDGDKKTSLNKHAVFAAAPFMNGIDLYVDAKKDKNITITYNGRTIKIPMLASNKSISVVVLD